MTVRRRPRVGGGDGGGERGWRGGGGRKLGRGKKPREMKEKISAGGRTLLVDGLEKFSGVASFESRESFHFVAVRPILVLCTRPFSLLAVPFCVGKKPYCTRPRVFWLRGFSGERGGADALKKKTAARKFGDDGKTSMPPTIIVKSRSVRPPARMHERKKWDETVRHVGV